MNGRPSQRTSVTDCAGTAAVWMCHECGATGITSNVLAGEVAVKDHWDHHCPSRYAHHDQPGRCTE